MAVAGAAQRQAGHDLRPNARHDLVYPRNSLVLLAGVPGAGKSTLLARVSVGESVMDSARLRVRWERGSAVLAHVPYRYWRPLVHAVHYVRMFRRIAAGEPLIVHDCLTRPWVRAVLGRLARRAGLPVHLILLDVSETEALAGQQARRRPVGRASFARHCRRWRALVPLALQDPGQVVAGAVSAVVLDRRSSGRLGAIRHEAVSTC